MPGGRATPAFFASAFRQATAHWADIEHTIPAAVLLIP
jgi:hypothetical protein